MVGTRVRLIGAGLLAAGLLLAWFFGLKPLWDAEAGLVQEIKVDMRLFILAPMGVLLGLVMLVGGASVKSVLGRPETARDHAIVWPIFILALASGGLAWWWMDQRLAAIGFVTNGF